MMEANKDKAQSNLPSNKIDSEIQWEIEVPIFRHPIILKQLAMAIGLPFGLIAVLLGITTRGEILTIYGFYALVLVFSLFFLTYVLIMVVYGGKYAAEFMIDHIGIHNSTQKKQAKHNRIINRLTIVLGLISGRFSAAGAGFLAQTRQSVLIRWTNIRRAKYRPKSRTILINGSFAEKTAVFCTQENYSQVEALIRSKVKPPHIH